MTPTITLHAASDGGGRRCKGPVAAAKWLTGSIATGSEQVISQVFDQAEQRDPPTGAPGSCWSTAPATSWS
ncbi:MAG TPA: hypothetical protein VFA46_23330 [Actinomycetes bacterium]|jgi:hypothetical protein|nr:hypothetical protein [Actinomycetes bacterium]